MTGWVYNDSVSKNIGDIVKALKWESRTYKASTS